MKKIILPTCESAIDQAKRIAYKKTFKVIPMKEIIKLHEKGKVVAKKKLGDGLCLFGLAILLCVVKGLQS